MSQEKNKDNLFKEGQHVIHRINKNEYIFYKKEIIIKANKNGDHFYLEHDRNLCLVYPVRSQFEWVHKIWISIDVEYYRDKRIKEVLK